MWSWRQKEKKNQCIKFSALWFFPGSDLRWVGRLYIITQGTKQTVLEAMESRTEKTKGMEVVMCQRGENALVKVKDERS